MMNNATVISSRQNPHVMRLHKLHQKKFRKQENAFIVEGSREITAALEHNFVPSLILFRTPFAEKIPHLNSHCAIFAVTDDVMDYLSKRGNPPDMVAIFSQRWTDLTQFTISPSSFWIAMESPKKPDNVGAVIRVAEAAGACGVILLDDYCDPFALESVRASTDTIFYLPLAHSNSDDFFIWANRAGIQVVGTSLDHAVDYRTADYSAPTVILLGTEYEGLSEHLQQRCHQRVTIPMRGKTDSLNIAVASGILSYEVSNLKFTNKTTS